jgi:hypothetical protein
VKKGRAPPRESLVEGGFEADRLKKEKGREDWKKREGKRDEGEGEREENEKSDHPEGLKYENRLYVTKHI